MRRLGWMLVLVAGCAHAPGAGTPAATATANAAAAAPAGAPSFKERMKAAQQLILGGHGDEAERALAAARSGASAHELDVITFYEATVALERGDFERATALFQARVDAARKAPHPDGTESWLHNALTWVRWGAGDAAGALAENQASGTSATSSAAAAADKREYLLHYWWDKAYLLLEQRRELEANVARDEYQKLADAKEQHDGLAVLAAWFALLRGDGAAARTAAATVNVAEDGDVQDLYVIARALEAGGDADGAAAVRAQIAAAPPYAMKPLIMRQIEKDKAAGAGKKEGAAR
jgi:hypothetical protein